MDLPAMIIGIATVCVAAIGVASVYLLKYDKRLYCISKQSINIMDIKDEELKETIKIYIEKEGQQEEITNLYTTKIKLVKVGFSDIPNPNKYPLYLTFHEDSKIIKCKAMKNYEKRGINLRVDEKEKNTLIIAFTGFDKSKKEIYFEVICANGNSERPKIHTPYTPLKIKPTRGYEKDEAKTAKEMPKTFSLTGFFILISSIIVFIASLITKSQEGFNSSILGMITSFGLLSAGIIWFRRINLLTLSPSKELKLVNVKIPRESIKFY